MSETEQLAALARLHDRFEQKGIDYWLFGGWAVDFHVGAVTRSHEDLDIAIWLKDRPAIAGLLEGDGWQHTPDEGQEGYEESYQEGYEDGYTTYTRDRVRLDLAFLERGDDGLVHTPLRAGRASWPQGAFGDDVSELLGTRARTVTLGALRADKSELHDDPAVNAKDRADLVSLARLG
jgi:Aminoglycoside-2''-adenylyltransferase